jgi:PAP2 superfamily protein
MGRLRTTLSFAGKEIDSMKHESDVSRREFLSAAGAATATALCASAVSPGAAAAPPQSDKQGRQHKQRAQRAEVIRWEAALRQRSATQRPEEPTPDELQFPTKIGSFSKTLPHDALGHPDPAAFAALVKAMQTGASADFEAIPLGGATKLKNPQAGFAFDLQGADAHALALERPPSFTSAETAAEMVELYWQALTRDVPFETYAAHDVIAQAMAELSKLDQFAGPKAGALVTPATVFRTGMGDLDGPYVSQFLLWDVPFGAMTVKQRIKTCVPDLDFMTGYETWLGCQNGAAQGSNTFDSQLRYIRSARDLGEYVHRDYSYQPYMNAALILLGLKAPFDAANPYNKSRTQSSDSTFGAPAILDLVARVTINASKTSWYHKWSIHRRLRPEEYGGRVHNHKRGAAPSPLPRQVLTATATEQVFSRYRSHLLPMAYPEGCPVHPAYPAAHAVLAGAAVTVLKAFFDESSTINQPVVPDNDGLQLLPWTDVPLTVGGELNKLASNIAMGRCAAGVHWRSDCVEGMKLGEALALNYLAESRALWNEKFDGFSVTKFDGTTTTV